MNRDSVDDKDSGGELDLNSHRPLQMVHAFESWAGTTLDSSREKIRILQQAGLGGLVANVNLQNYLRDRKAWEFFKQGVNIAHDAGLRVWIYDEEGYPSGAAGGRVLEQYPEGEARGLIRTKDAAGQVHYEIVTLYEATHATENFFRKRPYLNILDPVAVRTFVAVTHDEYARVLAPIGKYVEAFFTDEPSLITAYIPKERTYPLTLPWHDSLPDIFRARTGYDLLSNREHLFVDVDESDRKIRCDFYEMIADLCAETYFGQIQTWCKAHNVASSGHLLGEETMVWQTYFNGSPFPSYRRFDIPGIDMILSDPEKIMAKEYFLVPKIAGSAVRVQGKRRLMCEISDFFGHMDKHPASMEQMLCTAGILFSFGVTDMLSYYPLSFAPEAERKPTDIDPAHYRRYTGFVTKLHQLFASGSISNRVAVLYPITSLWAHFKPSDRSMYEKHPDPVVRQIDEGFANLCRALLQSQIDFDVVDEGSLADARVEGNTLVVGWRQYEVLIIPPADTLHVRTMEVLAAFAERKGTLLASALLPHYAAEGPGEDARIRELVKTLREGGALGEVTAGTPLLQEQIRSRCVPECVPDPASPHLLCTTIVRPQGPAYVLVNVSSLAYEGWITFCAVGEATGVEIEGENEQRLVVERTADDRSRVKVDLRPFGVLFITFTPDG